MKHRLTDPHFLVRVALLGAMGFALMYIEFPLPLLPTFLQYDFGDLPPLLASFALGPAAGGLAQLIKCTIFFLSGKDEAGLVGTAANLVAGGTLSVVAGLVYQYRRSLQGSLLALLVGSLAMAAAATAANILVFLPLWGIPAEQVVPMAVGAALPFNLAKGALTSAATFVLYKRVRNWLR